MTGRPDFYILMQDNTRVHGLGGQTSYEDPSEGDPCFAKEVDGFNVLVDRMHISPLEAWRLQGHADKRCHCFHEMVVGWYREH